MWLTYSLPGPICLPGGHFDAMTSSKQNITSKCLLVKQQGKKPYQPSRSQIGKGKPSYSTLVNETVYGHENSDKYYQSYLASYIVVININLSNKNTL